MSYFRTAVLLAGLTGLFMAVGYLIGGAGGAMVALLVAAATNLFAYWNSDRMVLSMHGAQEVDARSAPALVRAGWRTGPQRPVADAACLLSCIRRSPTPLRRDVTRRTRLSR